MENFKQEIAKRKRDDWQNEYGYLFEGQKIEREKDKIIFKMRFVRHAEKQLTNGTESDLTKRGIFQAALLATKRNKTDSLTINYSPTFRTQVTAETIALANNPNTIIKENSILAVQNTLSKKYLKRLMAIKQEIRKKYPPALGPEQNKKIDLEAGNKQLADYLAYGQHKPDEKTLSPKEMSQKIKTIIKQQIDNIKNGEYKNGSLHESLNITHDLLIASFLNDIIGDYGQKAIKPGEGFEIVIKNNQNDKNKFELILFFRGNKYKLNYDKLYE